jgi:hypothetical protein
MHVSLSCVVLKKHYEISVLSITYIPLTLYLRRGSRGISDIPPRHPRFTKLAMRNTTDVTGGKPIAVLLQSISGVNPINPLVAFYDIYGKERGAILLFCPRHHTRLSIWYLR